VTGFRSLPALFLLLPMLVTGRELPFLETRVVPQRPYVQAQVLLTLRLFRKSHLQRGDFLLPEIPGVLVEFVREDEPRPIDHQGKTREMIEQRYLLFPQRSGPLRLPAALFSGRELFIEGESITLQIKPPPAETTLPWLPASGVELTRDWVDRPGDWRVGEPRVVKLSIRVRGLTAAQLPTLAIAPPAGLEMQALRVERRDRIVADVMIGTSTQYLRLIPTRAGNYRLDPVTLQWWNTDSDRPTSTTLDAIPLSILPPLPTSTAGRSGTPLSPPADSRIEPRRDTVPAGLIGLLVVLPLLLIAGWRLLPPGRRLAGRWWQCCRARRRFHHACAAGDSRSAANALLAWASARGLTTCATLPELADVMQSEAARQAVLKLDQSLYGGPLASWPGKRLPKMIGPELDCRPWRRRREIIHEVIPPLNP